MAWEDNGDGPRVATEFALPRSVGVSHDDAAGTAAVQGLFGFEDGLEEGAEFWAEAHGQAGDERGH